MKREHTPGPWRIGDAGNTVFGPNMGKPSPQTIAYMATCSCGEHAGKSHKANAMLISAAPELLAALKALVADGTISLNAARAAILRAEGK